MGSNYHNNPSHSLKSSLLEIQMEHMHKRGLHYTAADAEIGRILMSCLWGSLVHMLDLNSHFMFDKLKIDKLDRDRAQYVRCPFKYIAHGDLRHACAVHYYKNLINSRVHFAANFMGQSTFLRNTNLLLLYLTVCSYK